VCSASHPFDFHAQPPHECRKGVPFSAAMYRRGDDRERRSRMAPRNRGCALIDGGQRRRGSSEFRTISSPRFAYAFNSSFPATIFAAVVTTLCAAFALAGELDRLLPLRLPAVGRFSHRHRGSCLAANERTRAKTSNVFGWRASRPVLSGSTVTRWWNHRSGISHADGGGVTLVNARRNRTVAFHSTCVRR